MRNAMLQKRLNQQVACQWVHRTIACMTRMAYLDLQACIGY